jgi:hypothetical protein
VLRQPSLAPFPENEEVANTALSCVGSPCGYTGLQKSPLLDTSLVQYIALIAKRPLKAGVEQI